MNTRDSLFLPLSDAGGLTGLERGALGARYRFWRDGEGMRHVFSVYPAHEAPDYPDALAVAVRRTPAGPIAMWAGPAGEAASRAVRRLDADEVHIHVFGEDPAPALRRLMAETGTVVTPGAAAPALPAARAQAQVHSQVHIGPGQVLAIVRSRHAA